jgi:hypothetical protein
MNVPKAIFVLVLAFNAASCASVVSGTSQTLTLETVPAAADCTLTRKGLSIGRVNPTPGAVLVQRTRDDITVTCTLGTATRPGHSSTSLDSRERRSEISFWVA